MSLFVLAKGRPAMFSSRQFQIPASVHEFILLMKDTIIWLKNTESEMEACGCRCRFQVPQPLKFPVSGFSSWSTAEEVTHGIDATGLTAIVTGGGGGIGAETVRVLALRGVLVIIGEKNMTAGKETKEAILKQNPSAKVEVMELDLSSIASVKNFVGQFKSTGLPLNILINNAGVMGIPFALSVDKIELHFAINHVGHFLMTDLLLDTMKDTARESKKEGRIVNVSSMAHFCQNLEEHFDKINNKSGYNSFLAYRVSKLATILHATELARRLKQEDACVTANSLHPGAVDTKIVDHNLYIRAFIRNRFVEPIATSFIKNTHQGAATSCYLALHPQVEGVSGKYFSNCNLAKPWTEATDSDLAKKLWNFTTNLIK